MDVNARIARRLRQLRDAQDLSLEALGERSGVSRSTISLIERGESSPTATVLDRLATALGVTVAEMFEAVAADKAAPSPLALVADQPLWTDPASGYRRRSVSPAFPSPLQLVDVVFPPGARVAYETGARDADVHQQVWMIEGRMDVSVGPVQWELNAGDCLAMRLDAPTVFANPTDRAARYLVGVVNLSTWNRSPANRRPP